VGSGEGGTCESAWIGNLDVGKASISYAAVAEGMGS
jgi:hypothetical protein